MKRALFVVLTDHPGGAEQVACSLARALSQRPGWTVEFRVLAAKAEPSFSATRLPSEVRRDYGWSRSPLAGLLTLPIKLASTRYSLVFTTHLYSSAIAMLHRRLVPSAGSRFVTRESTTIFDLFKGKRRALAVWLYRGYGPQDLAIVQTSYMAEHLEPYLSERACRRVRVLENPVGLAVIDRAFEECLNEQVILQLQRRRSILFCGSLIERKNPRLAIETFLRLRQRLTDDVQLVFMGAGPLRAALEAQADAMGVADLVIFLGQQSNPYAIMRHCEFGLLTSLREGFPNVVLEMMACGIRKIVMTPCAGDLDTLTGVTVTEDFSASSLSDALAEAIRSGEDCSATYRAVVEGRSVDRYLDAVLGETPE